MKLDAHIAKALRARACKFLGASARKRKRIGTIVNGTYDLRSLAVHAGRFDSPGDESERSDVQTVMNVLKEGQDLVGWSLVKMILEGEPVWPEPRSGRLCQVWEAVVRAIGRTIGRDG